MCGAYRMPCAAMCGMHVCAYRMHAVIDHFDAAQQITRKARGTWHACLPACIEPAVGRGRALPSLPLA